MITLSAPEVTNAPVPAIVDPVALQIVELLKDALESVLPDTEIGWISGDNADDDDCGAPSPTNNYLLSEDGKSFDGWYYFRDDEGNLVAEEFTVFENDNGRWVAQLPCCAVNGCVRQRLEETYAL